MLTALRIRDYAILESVDLPLGPGLTAITGETGAGKSILLDALALALGGRSSDKAIRHGQTQAEVETQFESVVEPGVLAELRDYGIGLDDQNTLILRRVVGQGVGKSRCWINGRLVTAAQLRKIATPLVDLSAQHAQHRLLEPAAHLDILDRFAGHMDLLRRYGEHYQTWQKTSRELDELRTSQSKAADRLDFLRFVHKELSDLNPKVGEQAQLQQRIAVLKATDKLAKGLNEAREALEGSGGMAELAAKVARSLGKLEAVDAQLADLATRARDLEAIAGDLGFDVASHARSLPRDDRELSRVSERLDVLTRAIRKYGGTEAAMLERLTQVSSELEAATDEMRTFELERAEAAERKLCESLGEQLHERRELAARPLGEKISDVVRQLGMPSAIVRVQLSAETQQLSPTGYTRAALWLRANLGESEGPLHEVASGGELSRVLLAVQRALGDAAWCDLQLADTINVLPTAIYDEADAGLSGTTGLVLGRFLREIGERQQVLCISHLPQVAAAADQHVQVVKREHEGRTQSSLQRLQGHERLTELARMLGIVDGEHDTALEHARQLIASQGRPV